MGIQPGWRKYSITACGLVMAFVLGLLGKLTPEFATVVTVCVGAFNLSNAWKGRA